MACCEVDDDACLTNDSCEECWLDCWTCRRGIDGAVGRDEPDFEKGNVDVLAVGLILFEKPNANSLRFKFDCHSNMNNPEHRWHNFPKISFIHVQKSPSCPCVACCLEKLSKTLPSVSSFIVFGNRVDSGTVERGETVLVSEGFEIDLLFTFPLKITGDDESVLVA